MGPDPKALETGIFAGSDLSDDRLEIGTAFAGTIGEAAGFEGMLSVKGSRATGTSVSLIIVITRIVSILKLSRHNY